MERRFSWEGQSAGLRRTSVLLLLCAGIAIGSSAQSYTALASFNGNNGAYPEFGSLVQDPSGNLYGTTSQGGANSQGSAFMVTPSGTLTTLYSFCPQANCPDGSSPLAGLTRGTDGNFYGTTSTGGAGGVGTVFQLTPAGTLTTLHSFNGADGQGPSAALIQGTDGNFYGSTPYGGSNSTGTLFSITPSGTFTPLYNFCTLSACADGASPSGLVQASDGNFYGATQSGGTTNEGTVFKFAAGALTTLYNFCTTATCADGTTPSVALLQGTDGNLYGTTAGGGPVAFSTIFKVTTSGTLTTLYSLCLQASCADGSLPSALIQGADGNFYGTTQTGGTNGQGTLFEMTPGGALTTLYSFCAQAGCTDGASPYGGLVQEPNGVFYGTTYAGGADNGGSVFSFGTPVQTNPPVITQGGVGSGADFLPGVVAGSWITIVGMNLAPVTDNWTSHINNGVLPTSLDGVTVTVGGQPAYPDYISPTQINVVAPNVGTGSLSVTVTTPGGTSNSATVVGAAVQPAFFQWGNYAVATHQDYTYAAKNGTFSGATVPAAPGNVIILWGTGFGATNPAVAEGIETPSDQTYYTSSPVTVMLGSNAATVYGTALAPGYAALYQVAIQIPKSLPDGDYPLVASIDGVSSPTNVMLTVQSPAATNHPSIASRH